MTTKTLDVTLNFQPVGATPCKGSPFDAYLLYNQCDGFHVVFARWDEDGAFGGFFDFLGVNEYRDDFYEAWAKLPGCNEVLFPVFGCTPSRSALALEAMATAAIDKAKEGRIAGQEKKENDHG